MSRDLPIADSLRRKNSRNRRGASVGMTNLASAELLIACLLLECLRTVLYFRLPRLPRLNHGSVTL